jgi:hypothetical protein
VHDQANRHEDLKQFETQDIDTAAIYQWSLVKVESAI